MAFTAAACFAGCCTFLFYRLKYLLLHAAGSSSMLLFLHVIFMSVDARATNEKRPTKPRLQGIFAHTEVHCLYICSNLCLQDGQGKNQKGIWAQVGSSGENVCRVRGVNLDGVEIIFEPMLGITTHGQGKENQKETVEAEALRIFE